MPRSLGEIDVGVGLIVGMLTGVAAFLGALMNVNYLFAGTVSSNPLLFVLATWLVWPGGSPAGGHRPLVAAAAGDAPGAWPRWTPPLPRGHATAESAVSWRNATMLATTVIRSPGSYTPNLAPPAGF